MLPYVTPDHASAWGLRWLGGGWVWFGLIRYDSVSMSCHAIFTHSLSTRTGRNWCTTSTRRSRRVMAPSWSFSQDGVLTATRQPWAVPDIHPTSDILNVRHRLGWHHQDFHPLVPIRLELKECHLRLTIHGYSWYHHRNLFPQCLDMDVSTEVLRIVTFCSIFFNISFSGSQTSKPKQLNLGRSGENYKLITLHSLMTPEQQHEAFERPPKGTRKAPGCLTISTGFTNSFIMFHCRNKKTSIINILSSSKSLLLDIENIWQYWISILSLIASCQDFSRFGGGLRSLEFSGCRSRRRWCSPRTSLRRRWPSTTWSTSSTPACARSEATMQAETDGRWSVEVLGITW